MSWGAYKDLYHIQLGKDQGFKLIDLADLDPAIFHEAARIVIDKGQLCCPSLCDAQGDTLGAGGYNYPKNTYCQAFEHFFMPRRCIPYSRWFGETYSFEEQKSREMALTIMGEMVQNAKDQRAALLKRKR